jgi:predicted secreted protein
MGVGTAVATYFVLWWLVLFTVLPWGVRREESPQPGNDPGAPQRHALLIKFGVTSAITFAPFYLVYWLVSDSGITLEDLDWTHWLQ